MRCDFYIRISAFVCLIVGLAVAGIRLSGQTTSAQPGRFEAGAGVHESHSRSESLFQPLNTRELSRQREPGAPVPPTRSSFMASWQPVSGAKGYLLDVSKSDTFDSYADGYHDLDVGDVTGRVVTGLNQGTTYYYRVRAYDVMEIAGYTETTASTTEPTTGLTIQATFDSSITNNSNAAAIEAMINRAIAFYESLFSDPITVQIRFRYASTGPDGTPLPQGTVSRSDYVLYTMSWSSFIDALIADASTGNDDTAKASLPGTALATDIAPSSANGRGVGLNTPPAMFADGTVGSGGPYDGIVTLNSSVPFQFTRPTNAGSLDAQRSTEHEIDEIIGLGSKLGNGGNAYRPQDLFSWSSAGHRNDTSSGTRYFSINGGVTNIVNFNQDSNGDFGDWLSEDCPQAHPYVQNAFGCTGQYSDVAATSPEGINLDVIGYDLVEAPPPPTPTPIADLCYPNFTTAEGCNALSFLTTGAGNTALGWRSLFLNSTGSFNTGVGGGALALNNADSNTAVSTAALLLNTSGTQNTALGTDAMVLNDSGNSNTATGYFALMNNTTGGSNTAIGDQALTVNTSGSNNTAIGDLALENSQTTSDSVVVGSVAGSGITTASNNIIIGHHSGVHSVFGQENDRCFIDNISGAPVSAATAAMVMVDSDGRLGTVTAEGPARGGFPNKGIERQAVPNAAKQAMLDRQVQDLEATITQQQQQIDTLTAQWKEQASQIQNVNAHLEMDKPTAKMIVNKPKAVP